MNKIPQIGALIIIAWLSAAAHAGSFRAESPFVKDELGRVVFFHGVNAVWKLAPYYPPSSVYPGDSAVPLAGSVFDNRDGELLRASGLTLVRLGVLFAGAEPERGKFDEAYLDRIEDLVDMLARHGVSVLLDFHQDMYNEKYQGEGFPDWAAIDDGVAPESAMFGFPANYFTPPVLRAFDNLWLDRDGIAQAYAEAWAHVAARFDSKRNVLGYDLFNEPWPGTQWETCANPEGCPVFDSQLMQPFYERVLAAIRKASAQSIVWWAPNSTNNFGPMNGVGLIRPIADPGANQGLAFHTYCLIGGTVPGISRADDPACPQMEQLTFEQQLAAADRNDSATLLTEFGASDDLVDIERVAALADRSMVSWTYWHYGTWRDPTGNPSEESLFSSDDVDRFDASGPRLKPKADVLIRPYPQAVAGTPTSFSFDPTTKVFTLSFVADPAIKAPTAIFVPVERQYAGSYSVAVTGPAHRTSRPNAPILKLRNRGAGLVTVTVTKKTAG